MLPCRECRALDRSHCLLPRPGSLDVATGLAWKCCALKSVGVLRSLVLPEQRGQRLLLVLGRRTARARAHAGVTLFRRLASAAPVPPASVRIPPLPPSDPARSVSLPLSSFLKSVVVSTASSTHATLFLVRFHLRWRILSPFVEQVTAIYGFSVSNVESGPAPNVRYCSGTGSLPHAFGCDACVLVSLSFALVVFRTICCLRAIRRWLSAHPFPHLLWLRLGTHTAHLLPGQGRRRQRPDRDGRFRRRHRSHVSPVCRGVGDFPSRLVILRFDAACASLSALTDCPFHVRCDFHGPGWL